MTDATTPDVPASSEAPTSTNVQVEPPPVSDKTNTGQEEAVESEDTVKGKSLDEIAAEDPESFWNPGRVLED